MQNKDLSRFFPVNPLSEKSSQFVRYDENGNIPGLSQAVIEQDLLDVAFVPTKNTYYKHIGPTGSVYNLTISITGGTIDNEFTKINTVSELSFIVIPENDYTLPTSITVANATYSYDNITGKITLSNPTADVVVNVVCESSSGNKLEVGKTYSSITIDPTKITEGDMKEFLARVCGDEAEMNLVLPGYFFIQNVKDGSTIPNNAYMFGAFTEKGPYYLSLYGQTMAGGGPKPISTDGWYTIENEDWVPLTESITVTVPTEMPAIESINDDFNTTLNGTVITGVESTSPKPVGLVPFTVGQSVSGIKVDTNAKTNEELAAFAAQLDSGSGIDKVLIAYDNGSPLIGVQGSADFGYFISTTSNDAWDSLIWVSKAMDLDSLKFTSAGWYLVNEDTSSVEGVSGIVELSLGETITVDNIDTSFSELNGIVFGAVEP